MEDAIRNSEMEGLHVNADPLADSGELVTRACARYGLACVAAGCRAAAVVAR